MTTADRNPESGTLHELLKRLGEALTRPRLPAPQLAADVFESPDGRSYIVEVPVPGLTADEIRIQASGDLLTIDVQPRSATQGEAKTYLIQELRQEPQARVFTFPTPIDTDNIRARLDRGILRIQVPKAEGAPSRVITIEG